MNRSELTKNEQKVLYGLICLPTKKDRDLSSIIDVKLSTFTSIKRRLLDQRIFKQYTVPVLNKLGSELLAVIYTQFNPVIPLDERVRTTKKTIEVFDEIFFSAGEQEKGFSLSLSKNYSSIGRINEIRTETFGKLGLLEKEYPSEVIFPFEISSIKRFLDFSPLIKNYFNIDGLQVECDNKITFSGIDRIQLSDKEKEVYVALVEKPNATTQFIGKRVGLSRHTISRMKKKFFDKGLLKSITIPNLQKLGFEMLAFYHINFNPAKAPSQKDVDFLDSSSTVFFARRKFEMVLISAYPTYQDYKADKMEKFRYLKENNFILYTPLVRKYMFERMAFIKKFNFSPIAQKIINN